MRAIRDQAIAGGNSFSVEAAHEALPRETVSNLVQASLAAQEKRLRVETTRRSIPGPLPQRRPARVRFVDTPAQVFVDVSDALLVHSKLVVDFLFSPDPIDPPGVRSMDLLGSAIGRQHTGLGTKRKYESIREVAATLVYGMIQDHPFHNGNKRTALVLMLQLLDKNHCYLQVSESELFDFLVRTADHRLAERATTSDEEVAAIADWLGGHLEHLDKHEYPMSVRELLARLDKLGTTITSNKRTFVLERGGRAKKVALLDMGKVLAPATVHEIRKSLGLLEDEGVTSAMFYGDAEPVDIWINKYRKLLRDLAKV